LEKCQGNCRKVHGDQDGGQMVEPSIKAYEKLAPVIGGIEVK